MNSRPPGHPLDLKLPPLALVAIIAFAMWLGALSFPVLNVRIRFQPIVASIIALLGAITCALGLCAFRRARTTVNPTKPQSSSALVTSGIYRHTRNPMYLGFLLILTGWSVLNGNVLAFLGLPLFVLYLNRFQIQPEERALAAIFGRDFITYCSTVRRWI